MIGFGVLGQFTYDNLYNHYVTNGKWSQEKYNQYMIARAIAPLYSAFADYQIGMKQNEWYMERYGVGWPDVTQPWKLPGYNEQQSAVQRGVNFVSDNVKRLYK